MRSTQRSRSKLSGNSCGTLSKPIGHRVPKPAVGDYVDWLVDALFLFSVRILDASRARAQTSPKTICCIDHSLARPVSSGALVDSGHRLEIPVFARLRQVTPNIFCCRSKAGREVNFVAERNDRSRLLVQVCESLADPATLKRQVAALGDAMAALDEPSGLIFTRDGLSRAGHDEIKVDSGTNRALPAWRFLLELS